MTRQSNKYLNRYDIEPAPWVMPKEAEAAKYFFKDFAEKNRNIIRKKEKSLPNIVPYEVRLAAIEGLVTDPQFKIFWEKAGEKMIIIAICGLFNNYIGPDKENMRPLIPAITKSERDKRLDEAAKSLRSFCRIVGSDISIEDCFRQAFYDSLKAGNFETKNLHNVGAFFNKFYESLIDKGPDGCRQRTKTHVAYPRSMNEGNKAERGRFIYRIAGLVTQIYGRSNYALTSRILNVVRSDLGHFSDNNVRQYMKARQ